MSWTHVTDILEINTFDTFAFINLHENTKIVGRVVNGSDSTLKVIEMNDNGSLTGKLIELPSWATESTQSTLLQAMYDEVNALPGADFENRMWCLKNNKYTPEQFSPLIARLSTMITNPKSVILKYQPDYTLTEEMLKNFKF